MEDLKIKISNIHEINISIVDKNESEIIVKDNKIIINIGHNCKELRDEIIKLT